MEVLKKKKKKFVICIALSALLIFQGGTDHDLVQTVMLTRLLYLSHKENIQVDKDLHSFGMLLKREVGL